MTRLLLTAAAALSFSCSDPVEVEHGTLMIDLRRGGSFVWPQGGDTRITVSNELDHQRGFAGFELDIAGTTLTARNSAVQLVLVLGELALPHHGGSRQLRARGALAHAVP